MNALQNKSEIDLTSATIEQILKSSTLCIATPLTLPHRESFEVSSSACTNKRSVRPDHRNRQCHSIAKWEGVRSSYSGVHSSRHFAEMNLTKECSTCCLS